MREQVQSKFSKQNVSEPVLNALGLWKARGIIQGHCFSACTLGYMPRFADSLWYFIKMTSMKGHASFRFLRPRLKTGQNFVRTLLPINVPFGPNDCWFFGAVYFFNQIINVLYHYQRSLMGRLHSLHAVGPDIYEASQRVGYWCRCSQKGLWGFSRLSNFESTTQHHCLSSH